MSYGDFLLMAMDSIANTGELTTVDGIRQYARTSLDNAHDLKLKEMLLAPKQPEWDGEGLPPAGTVCELRMTAAGSDWHIAEIKFASRNVIVWDWEGESQINGLCTAYIHAVQFRAARTPEQIAAENYEADAADLAEVMTGHRDRSKDCYMTLAKVILDAGYRKQEAP